MFDPFCERESRPAQLSLSKMDQTATLIEGIFPFNPLWLAGLGGEEKMSARLRNIFIFYFCYCFCMLGGTKNSKRKNIKNFPRSRHIVVLISLRENNEIRRPIRRVGVHHRL